jgi:ubiquinone/menaquinone biosynthesis C-methylase UbiE
MLKMYNKQAHAGNTPDFWEENWATGEFEKAVSFCSVDPLRPLFEKYLRPDSLMLEGGCGMGNYVSYYSALGFNVIGLDFAQKALQTLRSRQPHLKLCGGDVSRLPFADKTFDLYYSGGVVEHFERGAEESLNEARRVLKDSGFLLISVPYHSPLRRALKPLYRSEWRNVAKSQVDLPSGSNGNVFFQYAYRPSEFKKLLLDAGLKVVDKRGYAVLWGLYEIPLLNRNATSEFAPHREKPSGTPIEAIDITDVVIEKPTSMTKRLIVSEDVSIPVAGLGVKFMRWAAANMMMYVCKRN